MDIVSNEKINFNSLEEKMYKKMMELGINFTQIAKNLRKDRTTISKEVQKHRFRKNPSGFNNSKNLCKNRHECRKFDCTPKEKCYEEETCYELTGAPYVCNGCEQKNKCRKVKYKKRKENEKQRIRRETAIRKGRTYEDFKEYIGKHLECSIVEMDTVEGIKGGKVFLTLLFRQSKFMLIYLMENKTMECVEKAFKKIKETLGIELFKKVFEVILTDNGSEFFNPMSIEKDEETQEIVSHVFYCDPEASWQKGAIEKNYEYIRYVLPKGSSFDELTQEKTNLLMSNINSTSRDTLNGKTPYDATLLILDEEIINKLGVIKIKADEVNLSPKLLKEGGK